MAPEARFKPDAAAAAAAAEPFVPMRGACNLICNVVVGETRTQEWTIYYARETKHLDHAT